MSKKLHTKQNITSQNDDTIKNDRGDFRKHFMGRIWESFMKIDSKLLKIFSSIQKEIKFVFLGEDLYTLEKSSDTLEKSPDAVKKLPQIPKTLPEQMLKNLEGRKCEYLMSYDEEGDDLDDHDFSSCEKLAKDLPRNHNQYTRDLRVIPLLYRGMNLSLKDMQKIFLDEGLFLERTHEQQWFFTSLPEKAIPHAIDACAADITSADDMERMAVVIAIEPKKLTQLGYEVGVSKGDSVFTISENLPKEVLAQMNVYIYNHKKKTLDQFM